MVKADANGRGTLFQRRLVNAASADACNEEDRILLCAKWCAWSTIAYVYETVSHWILKVLHLPGPVSTFVRRLPDLVQRHAKMIEIYAPEVVQKYCPLALGVGDKQ